MSSPGRQELYLKQPFISTYCVLAFVYELHMDYFIIFALLSKKKAPLLAYYNKGKLRFPGTEVFD